PHKYFSRSAPLIYVFASDSHCDPGYLLYEDFCYHFESESVKNWQDAETHCSREQGHLASFHSEEQLTHMPGEAWVGLNDINVENQWVYTDGSPAVRDDAMNVLGMDHHEPGKLNDDFCTSTKEFICKKGLIIHYLKVPWHDNFTL
uniref:C-type lectin domain-containing protein n=1 Tax=Sander lucioperca TaxID=283035 RepID=A0A8C9Z1H0_SANLU